MYIVAVDEEVVPKLREYLKEKVATSFRQKVIYFSARGEVEFIESAERHVI